MACSSTPPAKTSLRTEIIELPITRYAPLPSTFTAPLPEPAPPAKNCSLRGLPAVCLMDALLWINDWRATLEQANADRAMVACLTTAAAAHPEPVEGRAGMVSSPAQMANFYPAKNDQNISLLNEFLGNLTLCDWSERR